MALSRNEVAILLSLKDQASGGLRRFGGVASSVMASVTAAAAVAGAAINSSMDFEHAIQELSAITGATGKDLEFLAKKSREFGKTTTLSAVEAAQAFKLVASAKPDLLENAQALAAVTREAITLAEASGTSLPEAAATLGASLNQFSIDADEAGRVINVLAAGAKFGASEISDTAQALKVAGTVASDAGLSFEETNTAIQTLAKVAIKGSLAGTGLRGVLLKLSTQTNDAFNPAIVGFAQSIRNLAAADLDATQKKKLFGQESITSANALIKEADSLDVLTEKLTGTNTAMDQANIRVDDLTGDLKLLGSAIEDRALELGGSLSPALREAAQAMTEFINSFDDSDSAFSRLHENGGLLNRVFTNYTALLGSMAADSSGVLVWSENLANNFRELLGLPLDHSFANDADAAQELAKWLRDDADAMAGINTELREELRLFIAAEKALDANTEKTRDNARAVVQSALAKQRAAVAARELDRALADNNLTGDGFVNVIHNNTKALNEELRALREAENGTRSLGGVVGRTSETIGASIPPTNAMADAMHGLAEASGAAARGVGSVGSAGKALSGSIAGSLPDLRERLRDAISSGGSEGGRAAIADMERRLADVTRAAMESTVVNPFIKQINDQTIQIMRESLARIRAEFRQMAGLDTAGGASGSAPSRRSGLSAPGRSGLRFGGAESSAPSRGISQAPIGNVNLFAQADPASLEKQLATAISNKSGPLYTALQRVGFTPTGATVT